MDYAKRAEWLVPIGTVATGVIVSVRCEKKGPIETEELEHFDDDDIDKAQELAQSIRSVIAAELQAAHDAGVAEGKRRCREATQAIIEEVGASGPMSLEEAVAKVLARLREAEDRARAAHDAGVAEGAPKWTQITDDKATWPDLMQYVLLTLPNDGAPPSVLFGWRGSETADGFYWDGSREGEMPLAWMPLPQPWKPEPGR